MRLTTYFLEHPVIASILNAMIVVLGILSLMNLPMREYPDVQFPVVNVQTYYRNASADVVENSVTNVLEDQLAGVEGVDTMTSKSRFGQSTITLQFRRGTSVDRALIAIRDAVSMARGQLPQEVREPVVQRQTVSDSMPFLVLSLESSSMDFGALTHYANLNLKNAFRSNKGVASVEVWGQPYVYSIALDAKKLLSFGVNVDDVYTALQRSNVTLPAGKFRNEIPVTINTQLKTQTDYENIIVKTNHKQLGDKTPQSIYLKQVASVKLTTDDKQFRVRVNGKPGLCIAINRSSDANPLEVSSLIREQMTGLQKMLLGGIQMRLIIDQADYVRHSLSNIQSTVIEAIVFVLVIVFLFLRNWKATLVPLVTIPISLLGAAIFLKMFGFSINIITLMAMVLAVGLVVDDAIVVLENIQRHIDEGLSPSEASIKGSREIGFAIVAMTLTLTSVYAPLAFIQGSVGQLFSEFAVALAGSVLLSGVVALTLSPLMCAHVLKKHVPNKTHFDYESIDRTVIHFYQRALERIIPYKTAAIIMMGFCVLAIFFLVKHLPTEMAPKEDRGMIGVFIPPIAGKDINEMEKNVRQVEERLGTVKDAENRLVFMGDWGGSIVLPLKPRSMREQSAEALLETIKPRVKLPSIDMHLWSWDSALPGAEESMSASELALVISTTGSYRDLFKVMDKIRRELDDSDTFANASHNLRLDTQGYRIDLDNNALSQLSLSQQELAKTIEVFFSGDQSLNFFKDGISYPILLKGDHEPWSLNELYVTNTLGKHISLGAVATMLKSAEPQSLFHYNQMRSAILNTEIKSNDTLVSAMPELLNAINDIATDEYKKTWTGAAKMYLESKTTMLSLFLLALIFIYAILAVQFENFLDPVIILLTVPLACSGALFCSWIFGQSMNIYTQVGLITLIGLITKHGILIVEFSNQLARQGLHLRDAVVRAATLRLRPILMTTSAMIFGMVPLLLSHDAGFESRQAIAIVLIGGLLFGTIFTLFVLPTLYLCLKRLSLRSVD